MPPSELDVLIATATWLHHQRWTIDRISIATGQGLPPVGAQRAELEKAFERVGIPFQPDTLYAPTGPDIVASSGSDVWKVECKGMGGGKPATQRNSFDRAVSSVVSYYDGQATRLGLALASNYLFGFGFGQRLPKAMRRALVLWVFLVEDGEVTPLAPGEELPYPGALDD